MFFLAKIVALFTQPLMWASLLLLAALLLHARRPRLARGCSAAALLVVVVVGWLPLPDVLLRALESRYPEMPLGADVRGYHGVVVLGGALESGRVAQAHLQPQVNSAAERMEAVGPLLRSNPQLEVLFTGGEGELLGTGPTEAERARAVFAGLGLDAARIRYEDASRNTYENAVFTARLSGVDPKKRWLLVTSAWHMPRSMATFEKAGWNVTAYPVDYRTSESTPWYEFNWITGVEHWQMGLRELVGMALYRLTGRL